MIIKIIFEHIEGKKVPETIPNQTLKEISEIQGKSAQELCELCGISKVMPISFDKLTKTYKINIMGTDFSYLSNLEDVKSHFDGEKTILGMVNIENGFANIYYNNNSEIDIPKQRFTIAHELAHCINHYDLLSSEGRVEWLEENDNEQSENDLHEYVCNKFARDFLIPSDMIIRFYNAMAKPKISDLANLFLVPEDQMKIKLRELGLET